jgi:hypothetical protein
MTAEALSAAEMDVSPQSAAAAAGSPRVVTNGDATPDLADATQSVVDVVAARLLQVAAQHGTGPNGQHPDREHAGGDRTEGNRAGGDRAGGDRAGGDRAGGDRAEGDRAEGDRAEGDRAEGDRAEGDRADVDRDRPVGDRSGGAAAAVDGSTEAGPAPVPTAEAGRFAATAVLDVLRASGWADAEEAQRLRGEADRLRELLDLVVRDHRAREASAAGLESQQHHWLIPLLRAAHGVAFGSLGAKVALRTAVQEVPERILATAGLRIDYGDEQPGEGARSAELSG